MKLFLTFVGIISFLHSAELSAAPLAHGTARPVLTTESCLRFLLTVKVDSSAAPGIQFYPMMRLIFTDGSFAHGALGCFPTGIASGTELGGDAQSIGGIKAGKTLQCIELVARVGDPKTHFNPAPKNVTFGPLDEAMMKICFASGGFVIRLPLAPSK
ncbi:hypothetical protein [Verrucomicrobium sp. BvORR106]|uniref:hypothetical protein n=1 Tax=Verrucomicrobium sp. BvORR106 TaxID=1403819 RepID=UPI0005708DAA|nr:hypothetical protein [Verrucomicrobium sp. BvORR106]